MWNVDQARQLALVLCAVRIVDRILRIGGTLVTKAFQGSSYPSVLEEIKKRFKSVKPTKPQASRSSSAEIYLVCKEYLGKKES